MEVASFCILGICRVVRGGKKQDYNLFIPKGNLPTQQNALKVLAEHCPIKERKEQWKLHPFYC